MNYILAKVSCNYADEFNVKGFVVMPSTQWLAAVEILHSLKSFYFECYFGTNEQIIFESFQDYAYAVDVQDITEEQARTLSTLFGDNPNSRTINVAYAGGGEIILDLFKQAEAQLNEPND